MDRYNERPRPTLPSSYRPSSVRGRGYESGRYSARRRSEKTRSTEILAKRAILAGMFVVSVFTALGLGGRAVLANKGNDMVSQEAAVMVDRQVVPRDKLASNYNVFIHDLPDVRVDLRESILDRPGFQKLAYGKWQEENEGSQRLELHVVIVDDSDINPDCLNRQQRQDMPELHKYLSSDEYKAKYQDEKYPSGTYLNIVDQDGVYRRYILAPARDDKAHFTAPTIDQAYPGPDDLVRKEGDKDYLYWPTSLAFTLGHEFNHFDDWGHPDADRQLYIQYQEAFRVYQETGDGGLYPFVITLPGGSYISEGDNGVGQI